MIDSADKLQRAADTALRWWALVLCWSALGRNVVSLVAFFFPEMRRAAVAKARQIKPKGSSSRLQRMNRGLHGRPRADGRGEWPPFGPRAGDGCAFPTVAPVFCLGSSNKRCGPTAASLSPSSIAVASSSFAAAAAGRQCRLLLPYLSLPPSPQMTLCDRAEFWCLAFVSLWGCLSSVGIKRF